MTRRRRALVYGDVDLNVLDGSSVWAQSMVQALSLAGCEVRLLLKAPGVVVLDEATAHLDSESEVAVQRALDTALHGRTSLVIAHRLSTVRSADLILVVDGGRIVQRGTHEQLLMAGGLYADLYRTQFATAAVG